MFQLCHSGEICSQRVSFFEEETLILIFSRVKRNYKLDTFLFTHELLTQRLDVANALYSCAWYRMPPKVARNISIGLNFIQNGPVPSIGPLGVLDYTAAKLVSEFSKHKFRYMYVFNRYCECHLLSSIQLSQRVYSFFMFLTNLQQ